MKALIVEDEILVAAHLEALIEELGHEVVGIAPDLATSILLAEQVPDIALVDLDLRDGPTGPQVGRHLGALGVAVIFVTGNPRSIGEGVPGTLGVFTKPLDRAGVASIVEYASRVKQGDRSVLPPSGLHTFEWRTA